MPVLQNKILTGHSVEYVPEKACERIRKHFTVYDNFVRLQPGDWFCERSQIPIINDVQKFKFDPTDCLVMTSPKSGTTWAQEIVWNILHNPNLDNPRSNFVIDLRSPCLENDMYLAPKKAPKVKEGMFVHDHIATVSPQSIRRNSRLFYSFTDSHTKPRVIKTHLPFPLLPSDLLDRCKVLYVSRKPQDVIISKYYFGRLMKFINFEGSLDDYIDLFINEEVPLHPYWSHLKAAWDLRDHPNLLFLKFEDIVASPYNEYQKINEFLSANLSTSQVKKIIEHTSFHKMKDDSAAKNGGQPMSNGNSFINENVGLETGGFFRKGKTGSGNYTEIQKKKIEKWIHENTQNYSEDFPYRINSISFDNNLKRLETLKLK